MGENLMRVTQRYNKSSFSDKLLTLKEKRTKARVSLNSTRWLTLMWAKESQKQIFKVRKENTFHKKKKAAH